jgi:hypothetical protein
MKQRIRLKETHRDPVLERPAPELRNLSITWLKALIDRDSKHALRIKRDRLRPI